VKPFSDIIAERPLAQHAQELLRPRETAPDPSEAAQLFGAALGKELRDPISALLGAQLSITCTRAEQAEARIAFGHYKQSAAHFLIAGLPLVPSMIISLTRPDALAMCDRAFGGNGAVIDGAGFNGAAQDDELPFSADLILTSLGESFAAGLGALSGAGEAVQVARRGNNLERLAPFGCKADTHCLTLSIAEEGRAPWQIGLMALASSFGAFLAKLERRDAAPGDPADRAGPDSEPFSGIPLLLRAVLTEMRLPVSQISALRQGTMLPLSLRREVPLLSAGTELARGTIGTLDDRIALKLTRISSAKGPAQ